MSNVDEELEEIKRLINSDAGGTPPPSSKELVPARPRQAVPVTPKRPPAARPGSGPPAAQNKQASNQLRVPAPQKKPDANQLRVQTPQNRTPAPVKRPAPPAVPDREPKNVRSFDISPEGKVTKQQDESETDARSENFKVNFDFDGEYRDVPEDRPLRLRREKRTGCIGGIMYSAFVICVSLVLASILWMATVDVLGFGTVDQPVNVTVPAGFTIEDVTELLYDAGLIRYRFLFNIYAGFSNAEEKITPGQFVLNKNYDYRAIVQGMTARAGVRVETTVTIPEGFTLAQIFSLLEYHEIVESADDLWEVATNHNFNFHFLDEETLGDRLRLEGFLFPETYNFFIGSQPVTVLNRFLREFNRRFTETYMERAADMGYSIHDIINIAALIEREAGSEEERSRIAAVIYNRLDNPRDFPLLQIDATIHYAIAGTGRPFSTEIDSPFNTYIHPGLPPGPIANPGMASIRAALYPDITNEFFYALNREGTHNFFRTYAQHQAFVNSDQYGG